MVRGDLDVRELGDAKLLASELVTNALMHGQGRIEIRAELDENHLLSR
jgi:anti-sigma regulatory factor (Ser/Thr protein kinase)